MTFIPEKKNALYVRGVVIACGLQDAQNDTAPNKEGIKKIFTNYLKQDSDVQHSYLSNFNVHQLENTITTAPMKINGQDVPVGSWIASHMVLNPNIIAMIRDKNLTGYSLGAIGDGGLNDNITFENNFLNKSLMYKDLRDYDELNPFFISFVDKASNGFTWEVLDYNQFLSKSSNGGLTVDGDIMTENNTQVDDEMVKVSVVERLLQPFLSLNKASTEEQKEEEPVKEEPVQETPQEEPPQEEEEDVEEEVETMNSDEIMAKLEDLPNLVAEEVVNVMKKLATESMQQEEASALAKSSEQKEKEDAGQEDDTVLNKSSNENNEDNKVEKSSNKLDEMTPAKVEPREKFLGGSRRDEYGRVRKYV